MSALSSRSTALSSEDLPIDRRGFETIDARVSKTSNNGQRAAKLKTRNNPNKKARVGGWVKSGLWMSLSKHYKALPAQDARDPNKPVFVGEEKG